ncbi:Hypothetical predicted protein, partial [Mytilus galloprovincialis]
GTYIGCFKDDYYNPILEASFINEPSMTISNCISICEVERHTFAGLRYGTKCFCDSVITINLTLVHLADTKCIRPCGGNATQYCGAWLKLALYQLDILPESTKSIEQISSTPTSPLHSAMLSTSDTTTSKSTFTGSSTETLDTTTLTSMEPTVSMSSETTSSTGTTTTALLTTDASTRVPINTSTNLIMAIDRAISTVNMNNNACSCPCYNVNSQAFKEKVEKLIKEIEINKKLTSLYVNSKICMQDERTSSKTIGTVGVLCMCVPLLMIVVFDISNCFGKDR